MNKATFLSNLESLDFISSVGTPVVRETKPDGTTWYSVNVREIVADAAVYRNVDFYVVAEGLETEAAFFKDESPLQSVRTRDFFRWMHDAIKAAPDSYRAVQAHWVNEELEMVVFSKLEETGPGTCEWKTYYLRRSESPAVGPRLITNHAASYLQSLLR